MKNKMKRVLAFVVAFAMVFTLMPGNYRVSKAADGDPIDVGENDYEVPEDLQGEENPPKVYDATESSYGTVVVPAGCEFNICIDCTINSLDIKAGGRVNVFVDRETDPDNPKGYNVAIGEITAESDAVIMVGGNSNITLNEEQFPFMSGDGQAGYDGIFNWTEFLYIVDEETSVGNWCEVQNAPGPIFNSYGPIEFNVMELHGRGEVRFKVESDSLGTNSGVLFNVDGNESFSNQDMQQIFENYTLSAGDKITIYAVPKNEGDELVHLGYDLGGEDVFNNNEAARRAAITDASSENGYTIELTESKKRIHFEMDFQNPNGGEPGPGLEEGEIGVEILKQENGSISIEGIENVEPRKVFEDEFGVLYAYHKSVFENAGKLTVNIVPNENYKVAESLSYANNECFKNIDTDGSSGFRNEDGSYTYEITDSMYDLEAQKDTVRIEVEFIKESQEEGGAKPAENEGLKETKEQGYVSSKFTVKGNGADGVSVDVMKDGSRTTMVYRGEDERAFEKYYRAYGKLPYATTLDARNGYYRYNSGEKVCLQFSFNFMYRLKSLKINDKDYGVGDNKVTTFGGDEVTFNQLYGDKADRAILLRAFQDQNFGCTVEVDKADVYVIELEVIPVDGYFTERESEDGRRYGNDVVIGNFLWFPTGGHAEDDAMTNGHLEIVSYEVSEADAEALGISEELRKGKIDSDSSFGKSGTSFYFHSPNDSTDINTRANGEAVFPVGTKLVCKLVPDYGYQLAEFSVNGAPLTPLKEVSTFEYTVGQGNFHFGAKFVKANNTLDCEASKNVSAVTIANDKNAAESGTIALTVKDKDAVDNEVASKYDGAISTIDLTLFNEVKKSETEYWETAISEFDNPVTISLTLDPTKFTEDSYMVVRNHITEDSNGFKTNVVEELENVSYDKTTGELSFETNKFSAYTIVRNAAEKVTLSKTSHKFTTIGDTVTVTATVTPDAVVDKSVTWSSADKSIAKVDENGLITAVSNGVTMITVTSNDNKNVSASMTVEVAADVETKEVEKEVMEDGTNPGSVSVETQIPAGVKESITISDFNTSTTKGELSSDELSEVRDEGANAKISLYVTSLASVPSAEADKVDTAKESLPIAKEKVKEIMKLDLSMYKQVGDEAERLTEIKKPIKIEIAIPSDAILNDTTKTRHYFMIDVHKGVATLTPLDNYSGKLIVERSKFSTLVIGYYDTTNVTNVTISGDTATLTEAGATTTLTATITPADATEKGITWSSSNPEVATVDPDTGKVTAVANGTTTIKATSKDNVAVFGETEITVSIPSPCTHTETEVKDAKEATCEADGYTGDTYCKSCGTKISSGTAIKAAGHKYDAGKVTKEPTVDAEGEKTYTCTVCGATKTEAIAKLPKPETPAVNVSYHTHIQNIGDAQGVKTNGQMAGTSGQSKRLENIWIKVEGNSNLGIQYSTHCQSYGWMPWSANGEANGTSGESKRLEAIKIRLTGADADKYDVYYRVHAQSYGWLAWVSNGAPSGTSGCSKRLEGIQIVVVKKGEAAPGLDYADVKASTGVYNSQGYINKSSSEIVIPGGENTPNVSYRTHVQSIGWQGWKLNGDMSGTSGQSKRLEGINIKLSNCGYEGGIRYMTHIQTYGWSQGWKKDGEMAGTSGQSKRLEAIKIELTGELANHYDIYYRVHAQSYGWLAWAKNGESAGTEGLSRRLEGIQIVIVPKGEAAPSANYGNIQSTQSQACIK